MKSQKHYFYKSDTVRIIYASEDGNVVDGILLHLSDPRHEDEIASWRVSKIDDIPSFVKETVYLYLNERIKVITDTITAVSKHFTPFYERTPNSPTDIELPWGIKFAYDAPGETDHGLYTYKMGVEAQMAKIIVFCDEITVHYVPGDHFIQQIDPMLNQYQGYLLLKLGQELVFFQNMKAELESRIIKKFNELKHMSDDIVRVNKFSLKMNELLERYNKDPFNCTIHCDLLQNINKTMGGLTVCADECLKGWQQK